MLDIDGLARTDAIAGIWRISREPALTPKDAKARARMNEAIGLIGSYGYGALVVYHLFPDLVGGQDEDARKRRSPTPSAAVDGQRRRGEVAGRAIGRLGSCFYVSLTPDADAVMSVPGVKAWFR